MTEYDILYHFSSQYYIYQGQITGIVSFFFVDNNIGHFTDILTTELETLLSLISKIWSSYIRVFLSLENSILGHIERERKERERRTGVPRRVVRIYVRVWSLFSCKRARCLTTGDRVMRHSTL